MPNINRVSCYFFFCLNGNIFVIFQLSRMLMFVNTEKTYGNINMAKFYTKINKKNASFIFKSVIIVKNRSN